MKRLHFIYLAAPLTVALNTLPALFGGIGGGFVMAILAIALWGVIWTRFYTNRKLRPEFAILAVVPSVCHYLLSEASTDYQAVFNSPGWQNFNFFLWLAAIVVMVRALLPAPHEYNGRLATDSVFIFMSIISTVYGLFCWAGTHADFLSY